MDMKKKVAMIFLSVVLTLGSVGTAYATTFGTKLNGASTNEVFRVKYDGAAWNYAKSGYRNAWFTYLHDGRVLMHKVAAKGRVTGSVWDNLLDWSARQTTKFYLGT